MNHACVVWTRLALGLLGVMCILAWVAGAAPDAVREPRAPRSTPAAGFQFEVVESFDARYAGDTPGHIGRGGGLTVQPHVALGDPVYQAAGDPEQSIGVVTGVKWDRLRGSLTVEFRPKGDRRIAVGDEVWLDTNHGDAEPESPPMP